mgnify:CR=1 FL=1
MSSLFYFFKESLQGFARNLSTTLGSIITIFLSLLIIGVFLVGGTIVERLVSSIEDEVSITAYVADDAPQESIDAVTAMIQGMDGVESVGFTTKEQALENFSNSMTTNPEIIEQLDPHMPTDKPRYLMGVGTPSNIIEAVARGVDFFDCVMPSRNGRHGKLFTWEGTVNIMNEKYITDDRPISESCNCPVCRSHSRAYLRHLFKADEVLALRLAVLHNLWFYNELMAKIREALDNGTFADFREKYSGNLEKRA